MKSIFRILSIFLILLFIVPTVFSQGLPTASPEEVGFSSSRLDRIKPAMQIYVSQNKLPGLISLVARRGEVVHFEKYGKMNENQSMQFDAIFRIASMTKPVTSTAIMMLYEEGRFQLNDPVSKYIPEFNDLKVFSGVEKGELKLVKPENPMTIRDLLTHTSGLTYGFFGNSPVDSIYKVSKLFDGTLNEMINKLAGIPLLFQPGTKWNYSMSTDVLGYLVEVISGKSFDEFLEERIFKPLKMKDTGFFVPKDKVNRFAAVYGMAEGGEIKVVQKPKTTGKLPKLLSGGGGLMSTISDYSRFAQMLLNKGELDGTRLLGRKTVEFMTQNHLSFDAGRPGRGFGLGFAVTENVAKSNLIGSKGEYWWAGIHNTFFWVDPEEEMILILMTQFSPFRYYPVHKEFKILTYQAIID